MNKVKKSPPIFLSNSFFYMNVFHMLNYNAIFVTQKKKKKNENSIK